MLLKMRLDHNLDLGRKFQDELSSLRDKKEIAQFFEDCGGEDDVRAYIRVPEWWDDLTEDWQNKILNLPFKFIPENLWFKLSQLTLEGLQQWYEDITNCSQKNSKKNGRETLSPKIGNKVVSKILPSPKRIKRVLKLHQPLVEEDFNVLLHQKDYDFTPENLEEFRKKVLASADPAIPLKTEDLFPFLKDKGFKPLLILSPRDRDRFEFLVKLEEKDKELQEMRSQLEKQLEQRDQRIAELEQRDQEQQRRITELERKMEDFSKFMEASKAAA